MYITYKSSQKTRHQINMNISLMNIVDYLNFDASFEAPCDIIPLVNPYKGYIHEWKSNTTQSMCRY